ncbi:hypothetical protein Goari_002974, partial [Gossypium aridum]|nr:hypothetical protein [Gossypium aridum]
GLDGDALQLPNNAFLEVYVRDLWLQNHDGWNMGRVHYLFGNYLACSIFDVPIFPHGPNDKMISSIKSHMDLACSRCKSGDKTLFHALRDCPKAQDVLIASSFGKRLLVNQYEFCIDWIEDFMHILDKKAFKRLPMLWNIWNSRNNAIFRGKDEEASVIWERAHKLNDDFRIHNLSS